MHSRKIKGTGKDMEMDIRMVIFDFDGTIADTRKAIVTAKQETMKSEGLKVFDEEACASTIGLTAKAGFKMFYPDLSDERLGELVVKYRKRFDELKVTMPPVCFEGVKEVLAELGNRDIICTIATSRNKKSLHEFLAGWGMDETFQFILCGEDTERLKPCPDPVLKTLERFSLKTDKALVVGDMPVDIEMGKGAGAYTCGVTYGNSDRVSLHNSGADFIIDSITDLLYLLDKCETGDGSSVHF
ncbi:MAG TPA: phosphoglycolate phosphatase [Lachnospiraceae bacterium]|nr:phosphoglycolate phosphatase [Lachnospiraceae bacterium]